MSEDIKSALTRAEWREALRDRASMADAVQRAWRVPSAEGEHALAALLLYGRPFGFSHADVRFLHEMLAEIPRNEAQADEWGGRFYSLAKRIAALLPPDR